MNKEQQQEAIAFITNNRRQHGANPTTQQIREHLAMPEFGEKLARASSEPEPESEEPKSRSITDLIRPQIMYPLLKGGLVVGIYRTPQAAAKVAETEFGRALKWNEARKGWLEAGVWQIQKGAIAWD